MNNFYLKFKRYFSSSSSVTFWHLPVAYSPLYAWDKHTYPLSFTSKYLYRGPFDSLGVPLLDYKGSVGLQYNPLAISQYGLGCLQLRSSTSLAKCHILANWLVSNSISTSPDVVFLPYRFGYPEANLSNPFFSGLAHAAAFAFLARYSLLVDDSSYLDFASSLITSMCLPIDSGGFVDYVGSNAVIEEFLLDRTSVILDGWLYCIMALIDHCYFFPDSPHTELLNASHRSLIDLLPKFDLGFWSRTDLYHENPMMPSSFSYHALHVNQLYILSKFFRCSFIESFASTWNSYQLSTFCRLRALVYKIYMKLRYV